ncbi:MULTISPECIES: Crp/Fnr family transcriptional regulator [Butyricimonas]|jgi:transcriptional regulatory protein|uniref:Crp/Fnr family transcriptional regulator n=1 Tax=Butyricimonas hominis TaxID=2763032 RepID=A0ABR7CWJ7_9BACT|nr:MULTISPECIES: Crp/Fnr family transcriptional regulator [Butyricimonas]MBC5620057.1 Crp/Fnr family transcriptional regulator [Butyricimonas hominis]MCB6973642.1 Crp/Fnr family transcriptional regulator [Butyricimonas synergistica]MCG4520453.1 Crp/Fnr family transcriptional regulator [Butyricimonas sp. DFI.6.44]
MKEEAPIPKLSECISKFKLTFKGVPDEYLETLFTDDTVKFYKKGEYIYKEGSRIKGCYFLFSGVVKIFQTGITGKEQIIRFGKESEMFGFRSVIRNELACTSVETLSDCILCYISYTSLTHMMKHSSDFAYEMMQIACKELEEANRHIRDIAQKSVKARLAEILLLIASDFGVEEDGTLRLNITREDLSNFVGTATETLIRLLSDLKNEGLVEAKGRKIKLLDHDKLKRLAD